MSEARRSVDGKNSGASVGAKNPNRAKSYHSRALPTTPAIVVAVVRAGAAVPESGLGAVGPPRTLEAAGARGATAGAGIGGRGVGGGRSGKGVRGHGNVVPGAQDRGGGLDLIVVGAGVHELGGVAALLRDVDLVVLPDVVGGALKRGEVCARLEDVVADQG